MPGLIPLLPQLYLTIGGADVPPDLSAVIQRVDVDMHLYLPDMFEIAIHDEGFRWVEHPLLKIGQAVEVAVRSSEDEQRAPQPLLSGEIVAIEATYPESSVPTLVVRGYDLSHRLHRGRKVRSFLQMTDSDIATRIAQERGLAVQVDSTSHVHEHLYQDNLTDYEFLARRARLLGFVFQVEAKRLMFRRPSSAVQPPVQLDYRVTLHEFRPRLTGAAQVNKVTVRGWDPAEKQPMVGTAQSADYRTSKLKFDGHGDQIARRAFGDAETSYNHEGFGTQAEGDTLAGAQLSRFWSTDVQADGEATGNPKIRAGTIVTVEGVGNRFGGDYYVTRAHHSMQAAGEYRTAFTVGGFGPDTTIDLLLPEAPKLEQHASGSTMGVSIGIVTQNKDPQDLGRVKVKFPWLADEAESRWTRVAAPMAGPGRGFFFLPEVNDEVLVAFQNGDFNAPVVIGALWNGIDKPPIKSSDALDGGEVVRRVLKTRAGHIVRFDDTDGAEKIEIIDKSGANKVVFDAAKGKITVEAKTEVEIKGGQKVVLTAPEVEIKGSRKVAISGAEVESAASGRHTIKGATVEIN